VTPPAAPTVRVEAIDFNAYRVQSGWTFIQGFVRNAGLESAGSIRVIVSLVADGDTVIGSSEAHIEPRMLKPGDRFPWLMVMPGAPAFTRVRVQVQARTFTDILRSTVTQEFRIDGVTVFLPANNTSPATISGEILNTGEHPAADVRVVAAIYDADGALYQVASAVMTSPQLAPGQRGRFEIRPTGRDLKDIPRFELFAEGRPAQ
jgi:hypothetical protein